MWWCKQSAWWGEQILVSYRGRGGEDVLENVESEYGSWLEKLNGQDHHTWPAWSYCLCDSVTESLPDWHLWMHICTNSVVPTWLSQDAGRGIAGLALIWCLWLGSGKLLTLFKVLCTRWPIALMLLASQFLRTSVSFTFLFVVLFGFGVMEFVGPLYTPKRAVCITRNWDRTRGRVQNELNCRQEESWALPQWHGSCSHFLW